MQDLPELPLISIIMPAYNVEKYIEASIKSVINQTYQNWELIVIDDGATDNTAAIVKSMCATNDKIIYLHQNNGKQAKARNLGIQNAKGTLLAFLDADDLWLPQKLEKTISNFDTSTHDLIFTEAYHTSDLLINLKENNYLKMGVVAGIYNGDEALKLFLSSNRIPTLTVVVKKDKVIEAGCFDEHIVPAEDYDLWIRLLKNGNTFIAINEVLSVYRVQESSSTATDRLATTAVLKCLSKNFSKEDIKKLNAKKDIKNWVKRWIDLYFTTLKDKKELVQILNQFGLLTLKIKFLVLFSNIYRFNTFKTNIKNNI